MIPLPRMLFPQVSPVSSLSKLTPGSRPCPWRELACPPTFPIVNCHYSPCYALLTLPGISWFVRSVICLWPAFPLWKVSCLGAGPSSASLVAVALEPGTSQALSYLLLNEKKRINLFYMPGTQGFPVSPHLLATDIFKGKRLERQGGTLTEVGTGWERC